MTGTAAVREKCIRRFTALGTLNEITVFGPFRGRVLNRAVRRVLEIDDHMSAFKPGSDLSLLSRNAGIQPAALHRETFRLLQAAQEFSEQSQGAFDVTVRPLVELWGIHKKPDFIPTAQEIRRASELTGFRSLILEPGHFSAFLQKPGQSADLGGIAKGYAADEVRRILTEGGVEAALINLGGNIVTLGDGPDGGGWSIGVQNPVSVRGESLGTLTLGEAAVVTSGSNERFFMRGGVRYHHILDPRTGAPAQSGLLSVTVVGGRSSAADALSTAAFVLGLEAGVRLLRKYGYDAVFVTGGRGVFLTEGLLGRFRRTAESSGGKNPGRLL